MSFAWMSSWFRCCRPPSAAADGTPHLCMPSEAPAELPTVIARAAAADSAQVVPLERHGSNVTETTQVGGGGHASRNTDISRHTDASRITDASTASGQRRGELDEKYRIHFREVTFHQVIGKGSFKTVYRGRWNNTNVAIVSMRKGGLVTEARVLQRLSIHPNLVQFYRWTTDKAGNEYLLMELLALGSLDALLQAHGPRLPNHARMAVCEQVCSAMCELMLGRVLHGDLAARNILVKSLDPVHVKVADFGLSRRLDGGVEDNVSADGEAVVVPVRWTAPEVMRSGKMSEKSDVWSYGVTVWEVFSNGAEPYASRSDAQVLADVLRGTRLPRPHGCPSKVYELLQQCWHADPDQRPTFKGISERLASWRNKFLGRYMRRAARLPALPMPPVVPAAAATATTAGVTAESRAQQQAASSCLRVTLGVTDKCCNPSPPAGRQTAQQQDCVLQVSSSQHRTAPQALSPVGHGQPVQQLPQQQQQQQEAWQTLLVKSLAEQQCHDSQGEQLAASVIVTEASPHTSCPSNDQYAHFSVQGNAEAALGLPGLDACSGDAGGGLTYGLVAGSQAADHHASPKVQMPRNSPDSNSVLPPLPSFAAVTDAYASVDSIDSGRSNSAALPSPRWAPGSSNGVGSKQAAPVVGPAASGSSLRRLHRASGGGNGSGSRSMARRLHQHQLMQQQLSRTPSLERREGSGDPQAGASATQPQQHLLSSFALLSSYMSTNMSFEFDPVINPQLTSSDSLPIMRSAFASATNFSGDHTFAAAADAFDSGSHAAHRRHYHRRFSLPDGASGQSGGGLASRSSNGAAPYGDRAALEDVLSAAACAGGYIAIGGMHMRRNGSGQVTPLPSHKSLSTTSSVIPISSVAAGTVGNTASALPPGGGYACTDTAAQIGGNHTLMCATGSANRGVVCVPARCNSGRGVIVLGRAPVSFSAAGPVAEACSRSASAPLSTESFDSHLTRPTATAPLHTGAPPDIRPNADFAVQLRPSTSHHPTADFVVQPHPSKCSAPVVAGGISHGEHVHVPDTPEESLLPGRLLGFNSIQCRNGETESCSGAQTAAMPAACGSRSETLLMPQQRAQVPYYCEFGATTTLGGALSVPAASSCNRALLSLDAVLRQDEGVADSLIGISSNSTSQVECRLSSP